MSFPGFLFAQESLLSGNEENIELNQSNVSTEEFSKGTDDADINDENSRDQLKKDWGLAVREVSLKGGEKFIVNNFGSHLSPMPSIRLDDAANQQIYYYHAAYYRPGSKNDFSNLFVMDSTLSTIGENCATYGFKVSDKVNNPFCNGIKYFIYFSYAGYVYSPIILVTVDRVEIEKSAFKARF